MSVQFEADLDPQLGHPRMRFNFANGWSASVVLYMPYPKHKCDFRLASLAACPTGKWSMGVTELGQSEAAADEVAAFLAEVASRGRPA
jgi:hypothetical protein